MLYTERKNLRVCRLFDASPEVVLFCATVFSTCVAEPFIAFQFVAARSANHQLPMHFFFIQTILL